jgi:medium-chain acyl-[acyl-carrier-protein] hydrolase
VRQVVTTTSQGYPWLLIPHPQPHATLRIFGFPHAGGGSLLFRPWLAHTPGHVEWCLAALPGRELRLNEAPLDQMELLVEALTLAIVPWLDKPAIFLGHSMGAFIAFEVARRLLGRLGVGPQLLAVAGQRAPHLPDPKPPFWHLPDAEFVTAIQRTYQAIPQELLADAELLRIFLPALRADFTVIDTYHYQPGPPLPMPIMAFGGTTDALVPTAHLAAWAEHTQGEFRQHLFAGGHFFLHAVRREMLALMLGMKQEACS